MPASMLPAYTAPRWPKVCNRSVKDLRADALDRRLRRRVNVDHVDGIGLVKGAREIVHQRLRPGVAMRLEENMNAAVAARPRGGQSRANLGGMMAVIVDHGDAALSAAHLEPAVHATETRQSLADGFDAGSRAPSAMATAAVALLTLCAPGTCSWKHPRSRPS